MRDADQLDRSDRESLERDDLARVKGRLDAAPAEHDARLGAGQLGQDVRGHAAGRPGRPRRAVGAGPGEPPRAAAAPGAGPAPPVGRWWGNRWTRAPRRRYAPGGLRDMPPSRPPAELAG